MSLKYDFAACRFTDREGGEFVAHSTGGQISSRLLSMRSANALLEMPQVCGYCP